jgi:hypothetical protein
LNVVSLVELLPVDSLLQLPRLHVLMLGQHNH